MESDRRLVERRESSLLSLFELTHELGVGLDPYAIAEVTLFNLMGHFGTGAAALWLLPGSSADSAVLLRSFGIEEEKARRIGRGLAERLPTESDGPPSASGLREWSATGCREARAALEAGLALVAPVLVQGRLSGVAAIGARLDGESYGTLDLEYLAAASGMVGVALENARLYHGARESNRRLRETNERLSELDRLKSEFVSNVSHELRIPLSVIKGYLEVLQAISEGQTREGLVIASAQANKLQGLLDNVLDFSKLEDGALRLEMGPHDPGDLLRAFAAARRPDVANGLREFSLVLPERLPPVACDPRRVRQVLDELVDNAVKFTTPGSHIRVVAEERRDDAGSGWVVIEIRDDGPGIPADRLDALFEPFRQGDGSTTREAGGMGLGLALTRRLAEAMGGSLDAASEPGVGSRFAVRLRAA